MRTSDGEGLVKLETTLTFLDVTGAEMVACCRINPGLAFCEAGVTEGWGTRQMRTLLKWRPDLVGMEKG